MSETPGAIKWWHIAAALALTALLDGYELAVTIPELARISGQPIFDARVGGYGPGEAVRLVTALGPEGRWYYLTRHLPADTVLALIEAAAIMLIVLRATRPGARFAVAVPPGWRTAMLAAPVLTLICDLGENALVAGMLTGTAHGATQTAVAATLTQAKWAAASLSIRAGRDAAINGGVQGPQAPAARAHQPQHAPPQ